MVDTLSSVSRRPRAKWGSAKSRVAAVEDAVCESEGTPLDSDIEKEIGLIISVNGNVTPFGEKKLENKPETPTVFYPSELTKSDTPLGRDTAKGNNAKAKNTLSPSLVTPGSSSSISIHTEAGQNTKTETGPLVKVAALGMSPAFITDSIRVQQLQALHDGRYDVYTISEFQPDASSKESIPGQFEKHICTDFTISIILVYSIIFE